MASSSPTSSALRPTRDRRRSSPPPLAAGAPRADGSHPPRTVSNATSASGGPRQIASAVRRPCERDCASPPRAAATRRSKRRRSSSSPSTSTRVTRCPRDEHAERKHLPKLRDEVLKRGLRGPRRLLPPQLTDQPVGRDHLSAVDQQEGEQCTLFLAPEHDSPALVDHLKRAEDPKLRHKCVVTRSRATSMGGDA